jgi:histone H3/H4
MELSKENTDMMEALIGAAMSLKTADVAMSVYQKAAAKGDTATMERAMKYVGEFQQKAKDYLKEAEEESKVEISEEARKMSENEESATSELSTDKPTPVQNSFEIGESKIHIIG